LAFIRLGICLAAASIGLIAFTLPALASDAATSFVLTANDTYGVEDCLLSKQDCGQIVADGWCEAHGVGKAVNFGVQKEDIVSDQKNLEIDCSR
jgi:hypothetical protein